MGLSTSEKRTELELLDEIWSNCVYNKKSLHYEVVVSMALYNEILDFKCQQLTDCNSSNKGEQNGNSIR